MVCWVVEARLASGLCQTETGLQLAAEALAGVKAAKSPSSDLQPKARVQGQGISAARPDGISQPCPAHALAQGKLPRRAHRSITQA